VLLELVIRHRFEGRNETTTVKVVKASTQAEILSIHPPDARLKPYNSLLGASEIIT
jgi:hypothetical protein